MKRIPIVRQTHGTGISRRNFVLSGGAAAAAAAFTIVPRHVLGGPGFVPPSEKIRLGYIGCGTQGHREMLPMLAMPEIQIVATCDPVKEAYNYVDWSADGLRSSIAQAIGKPEWKHAAGGIPGGRDVAKEIIETSYANQRAASATAGGSKFKGCSTYADFRELLDHEKDLDAVKIMTPDHLHATIAVEAMKHGKHVIVHKPLANRLAEGRIVIETARKTKVATHFMPASDGSNIRAIKALIDGGAIGSLREIHNWSNRPMWPQYSTVPTDTPPIPQGFDWQLWLGPSLDRPYHPHYTHAVFRGWYEFGGGSLADMGHYSLWPVFQLFQLDSPIAVESRPSHLCSMSGHVPSRLKNDYSFPSACTIRFQFGAKGSRPALDLFWYDGSMKPPTPDDLGSDAELDPEGMMFVGDKGKILAGFRGEGPRVLGGQSSTQNTPAGSARGRQRSEALALWVAAAKGGQPTYGDFLLGGPITDAFNLGAISLRLGGKRLRFDSAAAKITNAPEANKYLTREYRQGWELGAP